MALQMRNWRDNPIPIGVMNPFITGSRPPPLRVGKYNHQPQESLGTVFFGKTKQTVWKSSHAF